MFTNGHQNPTPDQLRSLVLDYLCHGYYTRTAKAFSRDSSVRQLDADGDEIAAPTLTTSHTGAPGDHEEETGSGSSPLGKLALTGTDNVDFEKTLNQIEIRKEIRTLILSGRVDHATAMLDKYFPFVLKDLPETAEETTNKPGAKNTDKSSGFLTNPSETSGTSTSSIEYLSLTSTQPAHLSLNLKILAFCEACRTVPLEYPPPASANLVGEAPSGQLSPTTTTEGLSATPPPIKLRMTKRWKSHSQNTTEASTPTDDASLIEDLDEEYIEQEMAILTRGRKLYAVVEMLPNPLDRATYRKELENVAGLLAYPVPEESPMAKYLSLERREAVADQINRAILKKTGLPLISSLELLVRNLHLVWDYAHHLGVKARPDTIVPPRDTKTPMNQADGENVVPPFDLRQFLDNRP